MDEEGRGPDGNGSLPAEAHQDPHRKAIVLGARVPTSPAESVFRCGPRSEGVRMLFPLEGCLGQMLNSNELTSEHCATRSRGLSCPVAKAPLSIFTLIGWGDDTIGNPHRAQIVQFRLFELII